MSQIEKVKSALATMHNVALERAESIGNQSGNLVGQIIENCNNEILAFLVEAAEADDAVDPDKKSDSDKKASAKT